MSYVELVKGLREHAERFDYDGWVDAAIWFEKAADAIEELQGQIDGWVKQERKALIKSLPKWIPVTERLPLYGQDVLAVRTYWDGEKSQEVLMAHIAVWDEETGEKWWNATNITHWMPLPEPPKEEAE